MIKIETREVVGLESAIYSMRNPKNSWGLSDSAYKQLDPDSELVFRYEVGPNDLKLAKQLAAGGPVHAKYRRMINVYADITAPLYWWKEADTYKVGTNASSCSTMHKIHAKDFTIDDFSHEHLLGKDIIPDHDYQNPYNILALMVDSLNYWRNRYLTVLKTEDECGLSAKDIWWQLIQLLPSSYNQKRTWMGNYEVLTNIYYSRKDHKLDEWRDFCKWIETLPYSELIIGG